MSTKCLPDYVQALCAWLRVWHRAWRVASHCICGKVIAEQLDEGRLRLQFEFPGGVAQVVERSLSM